MMTEKVKFQFVNHKLFNIYGFSIFWHRSSTIILISLMVNNYEEVFDLWMTIVYENRADLMW